MLPAIDWNALVEEVVRRHRAHTVLLFGSHARGDATEHSDVDLMALRPTGGRGRDVEPWRGLLIDLHLHDEAGAPALVQDEAPFLLDARVLVQCDGWGDRILEGVRARLAGPPAPTSEGERAALWAWGDKMRGRIRSADATLAAFQRAVVLSQALGAWAEVRSRWYFGPKATLRLLAKEDPRAFDAFVMAARSGAKVGALDSLLDALFPPELRAVPGKERL